MTLAETLDGSSLYMGSEKKSNHHFVLNTRDEAGNMKGGNVQKCQTLYTVASKAKHESKAEKVINSLPKENKRSVGHNQKGKSFVPLKLQFYDF